MKTLKISMLIVLISGLTTSAWALNFNLGQVTGQNAVGIIFDFALQMNDKAPVIDTIPNKITPYLSTQPQTDQPKVHNDPVTLSWIDTNDDLGLSVDHKDVLHTRPDIPAVPEPATLLLMGVGLLGLCGLNSKKRVKV